MRLSIKLRTVLISTLGLFGVLCLNDASVAVEMASKSGQTDLKEAGAFETDKIQTVDLSAGALDLTAKFRIDRIFKKSMVSGAATVENTGDSPVFYQYYVAFFDDEGKLLGAGGQGSFGDEGLASGEKANLASVVVNLELEQIEKVSRYQVVVYVDTKPIGQSEDQQADGEDGADQSDGNEGGNQEDNDG